MGVLCVARTFPVIFYFLNFDQVDKRSKISPRKNKMRILYNFVSKFYRSTICRQDLYKIHQNLS